jgi:hypothetical protein
MNFVLAVFISYSHMSSRHLPYLTANTIHCIIANQINKKTLDSHDSSLINSITKPNLYPLKSSSCTTRSASINMTKRTPMLHTRSLPPPIICLLGICHIRLPTKPTVSSAAGSATRYLLLILGGYVAAGIIYGDNARTDPIYRYRWDGASVLSRYSTRLHTLNFRYHFLQVQCTNNDNLEVSMQRSTLCSLLLLYPTFEASSSLLTSKVLMCYETTKSNYLNYEGAKNYPDQDLTQRNDRQE